MFNWKRALVSTVVFYAIIFLWASVLMFVLAVPTDVFKVAMVVSGALVVALLAQYHFFKGARPKPIDGLRFGAFVAVVSALLDIPILVYGFAKDLGWAYFASWDVLLGYAVVAVAPAVIIHLQKK